LIENTGPWNETLELSDWEYDTRLKLNAKHISYANALLAFWNVDPNIRHHSRVPPRVLARWRCKAARAVAKAIMRAEKMQFDERVYLAKYMCKSASMAIGDRDLMTALLVSVGAIYMLAIGMRA
jgi:hypothetical protein